MSLTIKEVEYIAELARLNLTDEEVLLYRDQLSEIIEYAARLRTLDTTEIAPTARISETGSRLREDKPRPGLRPEALFKNAPEKEEGQFKVPPVLN